MLKKKNANSILNTTYYYTYVFVMVALLSNLFSVILAAPSNPVSHANAHTNCSIVKTGEGDQKSLFLIISPKNIGCRIFLIYHQALHLFDLMLRPHVWPLI